MRWPGRGRQDRAAEATDVDSAVGQTHEHDEEVRAEPGPTVPSMPTGSERGPVVPDADTQPGGAVDTEPGAAVDTGLDGAAEASPETDREAGEPSLALTREHAAEVSSRRRRELRPRRPRPLERGGLGWVLPAILLLLVVTLWPLGRAVHDSLYRASLVAPDDRSFVGLDGYISVLGSGTWWSAVATTLGLVVVAVLLQLALAAAFATALRRVSHGVRWLQAVLLVPFGLLAVVTATIWRDGLTSGFGPQWFGYDGESAAAGLAALLASEVWRGTGITTLILLAGLARVSPSLREAAVADGANAWQRFWRVTRPAAAPAIAVAVTYRALDALRVLEGPLLASPGTPDTVPLLVWDSTFESFELGLGAVVSVLLLVLAALLGLLLSTLLRMRRVL